MGRTGVIKPPSTLTHCHYITRLIKSKAESAALPINCRLEFGVTFFLDAKGGLWCSYYNYSVLLAPKKNTTVLQRPTSQKQHCCWLSSAQSLAPLGCIYIHGCTCFTELPWWLSGVEHPRKLEIAGSSPAQGSPDVCSECLHLLCLELLCEQVFQVM